MEVLELVVFLFERVDFAPKVSALQFEFRLAQLQLIVVVVLGDDALDCVLARPTNKNFISYLS